jgi:hypothetical protein
MGKHMPASLLYWRYPCPNSFVKFFPKYDRVWEDGRTARRQEGPAGIPAAERLRYPGPKRAAKALARIGERTMSRRGSENPYLAIAVGFYLLALPLVVSSVLAETTPARVTTAVAAAVFIGLGLLLQVRYR